MPQVDCNVKSFLVILKKFLLRKQGAKRYKYAVILYPRITGSPGHRITGTPGHQGTRAPDHQGTRKRYRNAGMLYRYAKVRKWISWGLYNPLGIFTLERLFRLIAFSA